MARVSGCKVEAHHAKIQDFDADFYRDVSILRVCCACVRGGRGEGGGIQMLQVGICVTVHRFMNFPPKPRNCSGCSGVYVPKLLRG